MPRWQAIPNTIYERAVFIDSSAFIEIWKKNTEATAFNSYIETDKIPCYIHPGIIFETHRRLLFDLNKQTAYDFLIKVFSSGIRIVNPCGSDYDDAKQLIGKYWDLNLTYCDAISFSIMKRLGIYKAFSYDKNHFLAIGFLVLPS